MHQYEDLLIDILLDSGFTIDEALNLVALQTRLDDAAARAQPWKLPEDATEWRPDTSSFN
jgi:hypothetical protein